MLAAGASAQGLAVLKNTQKLVSEQARYLSKTLKSGGIIVREAAAVDAADSAAAAVVAAADTVSFGVLPAVLEPQADRPESMLKANNAATSNANLLFIKILLHFIY